MNTPTKDEQLIRMLLVRLERVSVDSYWAHRASGIRGSLLKTIAQFENGETVDLHELQILKATSFRLLEYAAKEKAS